MSSSGDRDPIGIGVLSRVQAPANPAAGADWQTNPNQASQLIAVTATLVTSATVANRLPALQLKDNAGHVLAQLPAQAVQAAGATIIYVWGQNQPYTVANGLSLAPVPAGIVMAANWTVGTSTTALQVGDQWSAIVATFAG